jgi:hypothetical protein
VTLPSFARGVPLMYISLHPVRPTFCYPMHGRVELGEQDQEAGNRNFNSYENDACGHHYIALTRFRYLILTSNRLFKECDQSSGI